MGVSELDYVRIGQRIREARNTKGWPQSELAFRFLQISAEQARYYL